MHNHTYIAIDLKSFYASVEAVERGLDPLTVNLVVADSTRTDKTICLAASPAFKACGIPGRGRLFEIREKVREINERRRLHAPGNRLHGSSCDSRELERNPSLALDFITAKPQMAHYISKSSEIYRIYLEYVAPEDIHVYSIDEIFIDATGYLESSGFSAREFAMTIILDVLSRTGITATAGIGTNLYLCKVAMDILAKHIPADSNGVRIAELDEQAYRQKLWTHRPLTDFWRIGGGYVAKLSALGLSTMGDIARFSLHNEAALYRTFGINAELLIDHAWGWEPCTMRDIKNYRPHENSLSNGQVLQCPYTHEKARIAVREMADLLALDLVGKELECDQLVLSIGYDIENLTNTFIRDTYRGSILYDHYGRAVPGHAHGTVNLGRYTSASSVIMLATTELYDRITAPELLVRRISLTACHVVDEVKASRYGYQPDLFTAEETIRQLNRRLRKEHSFQEAELYIKQRYGRNSLLRGLSFEAGATTRERNLQIGGHMA